MLPLRDNTHKGAEPVATVCLILLCVLVYLLQLAYPGGFVKSLEDWGEVPTRILGGERIPGTLYSAYWTWLSSMFMHGGFSHLLGNMMALWLFGDNIEWVMGRVRYILFYLGCGLLANVVTTYLGYESSSPGIGASGAIAGVMAAYLIIYPRARITSLLWIDPYSLMHAGTGTWGLVTRNISAVWYIGAWVLWQLLLGGAFISMQVHYNLGVYAHLAGAICGAALAFVLPLPSRRPGVDDPAVDDDLTDMFFGDEGDAGSGRDYLNVDEEVRRIRLAHPGQRGPWRAPPIQDFVVDELTARGDLSGAIRHCEDMRAMARGRGESDRAEGYASLIELLKEQLEPEPEQGNVGI